MTKIKSEEKPRHLTDRERILTEVIDALASTFILMEGGQNYHSAGPFKRASLDLVHFAPYRDPQPGDLVVARTGHVSPWKIGWYVEKLKGSYGGALIREIGSGKLCNYENESFTPIVGLRPIALLEGKQRRFYMKVLSALQSEPIDPYTFGGILFRDGKAIVTIRERFGANRDGSTPFEIQLPISGKRSTSQILGLLKAGGYGTKAFR